MSMTTHQLEPPPLSAPRITYDVVHYWTNDSGLVYFSSMLLITGSSFLSAVEQGTKLGYPHLLVME